MNAKSKGSLTMHQIKAPKRKPGKAVEKAVAAYPPRSETVPPVGTVVAINYDWIAFEGVDNKTKTPMIKLRYDATQSNWMQVPLLEAGMLAFYTAKPEQSHLKAEITSIIPSGMACYVKPL